MEPSLTTARPIPHSPAPDPVSVDPDTAAIAAAQRGDRAAKAALLDAMQDVIYRFCLGALGDPDAALDASQETALRLLKSLDRYAARSTLRTWTLGIALNVCREMRRARARDRTEPVPDAIRDDRAARPDNRASESEQRRRVAALLVELGERQREAIVLRYFEGLSVSEAAEAMGLAEGTVKATTFAALRRLRSKMDEPT